MAIVVALMLLPPLRQASVDSRDRAIAAAAMRARLLQLMWLLPLLSLPLLLLQH